MHLVLCRSLISAVDAMFRFVYYFPNRVSCCRPRRLPSWDAHHLILNRLPPPRLANSCSLARSITHSPAAHPLSYQCYVYGSLDIQGTFSTVFLLLLIRSLTIICCKLFQRPLALGNTDTFYRVVAFLSERHLSLMEFLEHREFRQGGKYWYGEYISQAVGFQAQAAATPRTPVVSTATGTGDDFNVQLLDLLPPPACVCPAAHISS